jgi:NADPH-dependent 2,4-dienoyl-CoA reductase/sulfur reductase-like enzyme/peroxiredoxin family protein/rhodanese-related sulfurtransferase/TusA-related sulfurtransferase
LIAFEFYNGGNVFMAKKVVIVGGVAGGASAAARLRRLDENAEIVMFERGEYISFANCGLPYYISGKISEREKLLVQTEEGMESRFNIDVRTRSEVTKIFRDTKEVEVACDGKIYRESYDYLILSPGAAPFVPPIKGVNKDGIYTLRNMADVDKIKAHVVERKPQKAAVIGGGYVGIEMAENLKEAGIDVMLIEAADQIMGPLDIEMARILEKHLVDNGVKLITKDAVEEFGGTKIIEIKLKSGRTFDADIVILAIGVRPETKLAKEAGLEIGERGGIKVDEYLRTSDPNIYAVGDAIEVKDFVNEENTLIPLAGPANKQGRIAADNICGRNVKFNGTQGTSIIKVFDLTAASTGNNEKTLKRKGIPYIKSYTHSGSHAGYYPGAFVMTIKLLFSPEDGKILGAQIIGRDGVDKRIDVLATAIRHGLTVYDLEELELAYAPPYSSAKDPVNMAGFTAANILKGDMKIFHWDEIKKLDSNEYFLLDVRTKCEHDAGHIEGSVNIPVDELRSRIKEIPKNKKILVYCKVGLRGYIAYRILTQNGFEVYNLSGGYDIYLAANFKYGESVNMNDEMTAIEEKEDKTSQLCSNRKTVKVDACGLQCPGPIMKVYKEMEKINVGDVLEVHVTDAAFSADIKAWCQRTGNTLLGVEKTCCDYIAYIMKGKENQASAPVTCSVTAPSQNVELPQGKTMVVFSGDLDKAIASFIIANGAAAMGRPVTMFFTFWGLNILRKDVVSGVKKTFIERMFGRMMPRGSKKLGLSRMNMAGMGPKMIRWVMKRKNISSLEELIEQAKQNGVKLIACSMSMDVMGIKREELIDGIDIGGVAAYLGEAEMSNVNLFI